MKLLVHFSGALLALLLVPATASAQLDADTYRRRPFYTYDLYDQLDGFDYGSGHWGGTDYLNYYDDNYYLDPDLYGDSLDMYDYGGYDYLGYDDRFNYDAIDDYEDRPDLPYGAPYPSPYPQPPNPRRPYRPPIDLDYGYDDSTYDEDYKYGWPY